jgi:uncharacterized GH25 family protein
MKRTYFFISFLFLLTAFKASAQDYILLPENFFLHKGDNLILHLINANQFVKQDELKYEASKTAQFIVIAGSKKADLATVAKEGASPIVTFKTESDGLYMVAMARKPITDEIDRDDFLKILEDEGLTKEAEKAKNGSKDSFREKYTWYMKSLIEVDKNSGKYFDKPLNEDFEIVLKDNPYKGHYGDDMVAVVSLKGKPLANANVILYIKTSNGGIFAQKLSSDREGKIYFKLTREGIYLLRSTYIEPSKDKSADFETWMTSFTFGFSSSSEMPNTYKEFGFGDKH